METVFLKLVNLSATAGWLVLAILLIRGLFRRLPKRIICGMWGLVALRLVCPFSFESVLSLVPSSELLPAESLSAQKPQIQSGLSFVDSRVNSFLSETVAAESFAGASPTEKLLTVLCVVWLVGLGAMLSYSIISWFLLRRRVATATVLRGNIRQCETVGTSFVFGLFRPKIYLPYSLEGEALDSVLAHEEAHLKRMDNWKKAIGFLLLSVYWFNPMVWLAYIMLCRDIETACDERVIRNMGESELKAYATALLNCSIKSRPLYVYPVPFAQVNIKSRIKAVMRYRKPTVALSLVGAFCLVAVVFCFFTNPLADRYFEMESAAVVSLEPEEIVRQIRGAQHLSDSTEIFVKPDTFDCYLSADFDLFFHNMVPIYYKKGKKEYYSQLQIYADEKRYFVTEPSKSEMPEYPIELRHFLEALKALPREQIREKTPTADLYHLWLVDREPVNGENVIVYSSEGVGESKGRGLNFQIRSLHRDEDQEAYVGYNESVDLFYCYED